MTAHQGKVIGHNYAIMHSGNQINYQYAVSIKDAIELVRDMQGVDISQIAEVWMQIDPAVVAGIASNTQL